MKSHIRLVGILHIVWNLGGVLTALTVLFLYFFGAALFGAASAGAGEGEAAVAISSLMGVMGVLFGCGLLLPCLPGLLAGMGLLKCRGWARWVIVVISVLNLPLFPLGTALGVYSLWALLNSEAEFVFKGGVD